MRIFLANMLVCAVTVVACILISQPSPPDPADVHGLCVASQPVQGGTGLQFYVSDVAVPVVAHGKVSCPNGGAFLTTRGRTDQ